MHTQITLLFFSAHLHFLKIMYFSYIFFIFINKNINRAKILICLCLCLECLPYIDRVQMWSNRNEGVFLRRAFTLVNSSLVGSLCHSL